VSSYPIESVQNLIYKYSEIEKDFGRDVWNLMGLPIDKTSMENTIDKVNNTITSKEKCFLSTPNLNFLINSLEDKDFKNSVINSHHVIADGMPLIWISKILNIPINERVSGSGLIELLRSKESSGKKKIKVFFFGGMDGIAQKASEVIKNENKGMCTAGYLNPGFVSVEEMSTPEIIEEINNANPDLLIVSLGAKKGQEWIQTNFDQLNCNVISHLGAVVNFVAGNIERSPKWIQQIGMEWLWRIYQEPLLFKRYINDGSSFIKLLFKYVIPLCILQKKLLKENSMDNGDVSFRDSFYSTIIELKGNITSKQIDKVRYYFSIAAASQKEVQIECENLTYIDAANLGQLLLLLKYKNASDKKVKIVNLNKRLKKLISLHYIKTKIIEYPKNLDQLEIQVA